MIYNSCTNFQIKQSSSQHEDNFFYSTQKVKDLVFIGQHQLSAHRELQSQRISERALQTHQIEISETLLTCDFLKPSVAVDNLLICKLSKWVTSLSQKLLFVPIEIWRVLRLKNVYQDEDIQSENESVLEENSIQIPNCVHTVHDNNITSNTAKQNKNQVTDVNSIGLMLGNSMVKMKQTFFQGDSNVGIAFKVLIKGDSSFNILLRSKTLKNPESYILQISKEGFMNNSKCYLLIGFNSIDDKEYLFYKKTEIPITKNKLNNLEDNLYIEGFINDYALCSISIELFATQQKQDIPFDEVKGKLQINFDDILIPYFEPQTIYFAGLGFYVYLQKLEISLNPKMVDRESKCCKIY